MRLKSLGLDDTEYLNNAINRLLRVFSEIEKLNRRIFIKGILGLKFYAQKQNSQAQVAFLVFCQNFKAAVKPILCKLRD